jgi:hypothetical protein
VRGVRRAESRARAASSAFSTFSRRSTRTAARSRLSPAAKRGSEGLSGSSSSSFAAAITASRADARRALSPTLQAGVAAATRASIDLSDMDENGEIPRASSTVRESPCETRGERYCRLAPSRRELKTRKLRSDITFALLKSLRTGIFESLIRRAVSLLVTGPSLTRSWWRPLAVHCKPTSSTSSRPKARYSRSCSRASPAGFLLPLGRLV